MKKILLITLITLACFGTTPAFAMEGMVEQETSVISQTRETVVVSQEENVVENDVADNESLPYAITTTTLWDGSYTGTSFNKIMTTPGKNLNTGAYNTEYMFLLIKNNSAGSVYANIVKDQSALGGTVPVPGGSRTLASGETWMITVSYQDFLIYTSNSMEYGLVQLIVRPVSAGDRISVEGYANFYRG